jgi:hypothetical protein
VSKWTVHDRYGNAIYMTQERWKHILESRPDLEDHLDEFLETLRTGRRRQDSLVPNKYFYYKHFTSLLPENNHLIAVVIFKTQVDESGNYVPNNFVTTGWAKYIQRGEANE